MQICREVHVRCQPFTDKIYQLKMKMVQLGYFLSVNKSCFCQCHRTRDYLDRQILTLSSVARFRVLTLMHEMNVSSFARLALEKWKQLQLWPSELTYTEIFGRLKLVFVIIC